jgi:signal transduction histidine kinase/DNA-binding response OmpR family regulator
MKFTFKEIAVMRTIAARMALLTITALLGLVLVTGVGRYEMERVYDGANFGNVNAVPSLMVLDEMRRNFLELTVQLNRLLGATDNAELERIKKQVETTRHAVSHTIVRYETDGCLGTDCFADARDKSMLEQEKIPWQKYDSHIDAILAANNKSEIRSMLLELDPSAAEFTDLITSHVKYNADAATAQTIHAVEVKSEALYITLGICAVLLLCIAGLGFRTARAIVSQLGGEPGAAAHITSLLATGDLGMEIPLKPGDDNSLMARIRFMRDTMERLASRAEAIGRGELDGTVELASEQDRLGKAINDMTQMLRVGKAADERRNWLKDGYAQISAALTGDLGTEQLADNAIAMLGRYLEAGRGVFYVYSQSSNQLELLGSYMYTERNNVGARFALGQGAIGQVARERKPIILTVAEDDAPPITTGTTSNPPHYTYTYPLLHESELIGVIELSSAERFNETKQEFLGNVTGMLASLLYVADQRVHIRRLLEISEAAEKESRLQSEQMREINARMEEQQQQLQQQTEELQQSNAQMEEQQQQLQQQAEELRQSNAQMDQQRTQLQQQNEQLQEARLQQDAKARQLNQASQYKSEFLSNMSHELRTPLNSIILLSKMMSNNDAGPDKVEGQALKWAQIIHRSGQELLRLINDVLDLSKVEAGRMEIHAAPVSSSSICNEMQSLFEHMARERGLELIIDDRLRGEFVTDWDKLAQILRNLMGNAIKFTRNGSVTLSLTRDDSRTLPIRVAVRDTGIGVAPEKRSVIFEAFQQADGSTSREFGGTGLGLTISLRFAQVLGGTIELESTPGTGSEFSVLLPERSPAAMTVPTSAPSISVSTPAPISAVNMQPLEDDRDHLQQGDLTILLIDDDSAFCQSLLIMNRRLGYRTLLARSGAEGLELTRRHKPHGILLDLGLPDMDGVQVLHEIKSNPELARIPVHIVSARDRDDALLQQGAIGFLQKPADPAGLAAAEVALLAAVGPTQNRGVLVIEYGGLTAAGVAVMLGTDHGPLHAAAPGANWRELLQLYPSRVAIIGLNAANPLPSLNAAAGLRTVQADIAIVFYAERTPDDDTAQQLHRYSDCIIVQAPHAERRLLENVERFLRGVPQERAALQAPPAPVSGKVLAGRRILLADDDPRNLFVITAALERHGAELFSAVNGKRALEFLANQPVDMVLMDIMMPEMDGLQAIAAIRADPRLTHIPVLAFTAKAAAADQAEAMAAGADDYLAKPVDYDVLVAKAIRWCAGR